MNVNDEGLKLLEDGPVWNIKVGVYSQLSETDVKVLEKPKKWKMKVILN